MNHLCLILNYDYNRISLKYLVLGFILLFLSLNLIKIFIVTLCLNIVSLCRFYLSIFLSLAYLLNMIREDADKNLMDHR